MARTGFGRTVAAASTQDGHLVNAEVARSGFAAVVASGEQGSTLSPVEAAAREALADKRGLHSPEIGCTVPGKVKALLDVVARVPSGPSPGIRAVDLEHAAGAATDARAAADELVLAFQQNRQDVVWRVLDPAERAELEQQARTARDQVAATEVTLRNAASAAFNQDATQTAVRVEADRVAKQWAAIRAAQARRAAAAARRAIAAREAQKAVQSSHSGSSTHR